ncbi:MAG: class II glutamine amidotransferase [Proteobacteria bacterium]|nr:class II glutamine amidotransferase [Pseudomonadota bacterium]
MCRLFGFRSVIHSQVHSSLVSADNALAIQSNEHSDGWGVAYYLAGAPHIIKTSQAAIECKIFQKVSGIVSSETVLAHLRRATLGSKNILNTHPFQYGNWVFAHNGHIKNFSRHKAELLKRISPDLKRFIMGETDSEVIFYYILSHLQANIDLNKKDCPVKTLEVSVREAIDSLVNQVGDFAEKDDAGKDETYLTFILTNGETMIAHQGGKHLYYSTYKNRCPDRDSCTSFSPECEAATESGRINHLIFSSEPLSGENVWIALDRGQLVGVDSDMKINFF